MYSLQINIDRISALAKSKGLSINQMLKNAELSTTILDNMKRGKLPSVDKIQSIAEYFDCSVDYLLGRTDNFHNNLYSDKEQSENNLSSDEQKLMDIYNSLSDDDKILLMAYGLQLQRNMPILNVVNKKQDTEEELRVVARGEGLTTIKANTSDIDDDIKRHIHKDKI